VAHDLHCGTHLKQRSSKTSNDSDVHYSIT
jgi:hypothetical protein